MFNTVLIANRGEIALRVIRACRQMNVRSVVVHSTADAEASPTREADRAICIGDAKSEDSYLNMDAVLQAAEQVEACAIHPGYGFLAENALFADRCRQQKLSFIGPSARVIRLLGDKVTARGTIRAAAGSAFCPAITNSSSRLHSFALSAAPMAKLNESFNFWAAAWMRDSKNRS